MCVFFLKQKTAYEMRISDWSSDVCSSDLCVTRSDIDHEGTWWHQMPRADQLTQPYLVCDIGEHLTQALAIPAIGRSSHAVNQRMRVLGQDRVDDLSVGGRRAVVDRKSTRLNSSH